MFPRFKVWLHLTVALALGMTLATVTPGCNKPAPPVDEPGDAIIEPGDPVETPETPDSPDTPPEEKPAEETPAETPAEEKPVEPAETPVVEEKPAEEKPAEEKPAKEKPAEEKPAEPAEEKPAEPAEEKPAEEKPAEAPAEEKPATPDSANSSATEAKAGPHPPEPPSLVENPVDPSANPEIKPGDWPQWGGTSYRNNVPVGEDVPIEWNVGDFDRTTGKWIKEGAENIKWASSVGSQTYGNVVVAQGKAFVGTNNGAGYLARYPSQIDLGCLLCFDEKDGKFLWQDSSEKLPTGRVHDWPLQGICCAPYVEGDRLWFVTSRGEVVCADVEGFYDGEDDGPLTDQWGRLFDIRKLEDAEADQVQPAIDALNEGKVNETLREQFAARFAELPEDVKVETVKEGSSWKLTANIDGNERQIEIKLVGPNLSAFKLITPADKEEADRIWVFDMMSKLGVSQHNMCSCSITALGDIIFVNTSNGLDESHINLPAPDAPSFIAMNKNTGEVLWTDKSPGENILHGQWSSPTVGVLGGVPQVIFGGGDGWVYSFVADEGNDGKPTLLWKFDANPKESKWILGGRGTRNNIIATPVIYDGLVYVAVGQDPEHGEGVGHLWCLNPNRRGDVSPQLAVKGGDRQPIPHRRLQAVIEEEGELAVDNPNSAVVWHYSTFDQNGDGEIDFEEQMHRSCGTVAIKNDLLYIADFSGLFHCLDAKTGKVHWTYDMLAAAWGSPLIVDGHVYIGDEDGDVSIFDLSSEPHEPIAEINMGNSVYSTPIVANGTLFISNKTFLFAIEAEGDAGEEAAE